MHILQGVAKRAIYSFMQTTSDDTHPAPIFLICSERSGSNLLSSIVGQLPEVYAHPPYHLGRDLILRLHDVSKGEASSAALDVLRKNALKKVSKYRGDDEASRLEEWLDQQTDISPRSIARFIFQEMPLEAHGKHALIKENNVHQLLFFFIDCFPDAKFIFQVRDPPPALRDLLK